MTARRLLAVLALLVAIPLVWSWWSSDRRRIGRQIDRLEERVEKSGEETAIVGAARARAVTDLFASDFEVRARQLRFRTRDRQELARFVLRHRSSTDAIDLRIVTESLSLAPEHGRATQVATLEFLTGGPLSSSAERYRVQVNWVIERGSWRIDYIDLLEIVDR